MLDPFGIWQTARDANLEAWSKIMIELVNTEAYAKATALMLNNYLSLSIPFQQMLEKTMAQTLSNLNMPTRSDVTNLATRLTNIEIKLDDLAAEVETLKQTKKNQLGVQNKLKATEEK